MGTTVTSTLYIGFRIEESDLWDKVPANVATCEKGHEQAPGQGPFCSQDGLKFELRHGRQATAKFKALAEHLKWSADDPGLYGWLQGYERIYTIRQEDEVQEGQVGIYVVNRKKPLHEDRPLLAVAKVVGVIQGWSDKIPNWSMSWDPEELAADFKLLEEVRKAAGFVEPSRLFFSLYHS